MSPLLMAALLTLIGLWSAYGTMRDVKRLERMRIPQLDLREARWKGLA